MPRLNRGLIKAHPLKANMRACFRVADKPTVVDRNDDVTVSGQRPVVTEQRKDERNRRDGDENEAVRRTETTGSIFLHKASLATKSHALHTCAGHEYSLSVFQFRRRAN